MRTHQEIIGELIGNADEFKRVATQITEPLISERPAEGQWSIKEVLWHLVDIQDVCAGRVEKMIAEDNPPIELYDDERENRERDHRQDDLQQALGAFLVKRIDLIKEVYDLPDSDWSRTGEHSMKKDFTIEYVLNDMLDHEREHFEQIKQMASRQPADA